MSTVTTPRRRRPSSRPWQQLVIIWALLLTVPFWLPLLGGYTAMAGRVLVIGAGGDGLQPAAGLHRRA